MCICVFFFQSTIKCVCGGRGGKYIWLPLSNFATHHLATEVPFRSTCPLCTRKPKEQQRYKMCLYGLFQRNIKLLVKISDSQPLCHRWEIIGCVKNFFPNFTQFFGTLPIYFKWCTESPKKSVYCIDFTGSKFMNRMRRDHYFNICTFCDTFLNVQYVLAQVKGRKHWFGSQIFV